MSKKEYLKGMLIGLVLSTMLCWIALPAMAVDAPEKIKVGVILPLSGPVSWAGSSIKQGADLALEDANAAGGSTLRSSTKRFLLK